MSLAYASRDSWPQQRSFFFFQKGYNYIEWGRGKGGNLPLGVYVHSGFFYTTKSKGDICLKQTFSWALRKTSVSIKSIWDFRPYEPYNERTSIYKEAAGWVAYKMQTRYIFQCSTSTNRITNLSLSKLDSTGVYKPMLTGWSKEFYLKMHDATKVVIWYDETGTVRMK